MLILHIMAKSFEENQRGELNTPEAGIKENDDSQISVGTVPLRAQNRVAVDKVGQRILQCSHKGRLG